MKTSVLIALLATAAIPAFAADQNYPVKASPPTAVATPTSNWGGFEIGVDGGYGWGGSTIDFANTNTRTCVGNTVLCGFIPNTTPPTMPFANPAPVGFLFGGHLGYNWQYGNVVTGLEVDYLDANMTDSQTAALGTPTFPCAIKGVACTASQTLSTKIDALASGRGKLGYAINDNFMIYGTGGVAWEHGEGTYATARSITVSPPLVTPATTVSVSTSQTDFANSFGWVVGGGAEMKLVNNILLRAQFLHYDFGDVSFFAGTNNAVNAKTTVNAVTGGISYKFGS